MSRIKALYNDVSMGMQKLETYFSDWPGLSLRTAVSTVYYPHGLVQAAVYYNDQGYTCRADFYFYPESEFNLDWCIRKVKEYVTGGAE